MSAESSPQAPPPLTFEEALAETLVWLDDIYWRPSGWPDGLVFDVDASCLESDAAAVDQVWRANANAADRVRLMLALAENLALEKPIPTKARLWLIRLLRDELPSPPKTRGRPSDWRTPQIVHRAVERLVARGMIATRNDASVEVDEGGRERGLSACDVVAEAFSMRGMSPASFGKIKETWIAEKRRMADDD